MGYQKDWHWELEMLLGSLKELHLAEDWQWGQHLVWWMANLMGLHWEWSWDFLMEMQREQQRGWHLVQQRER